MVSQVTPFAERSGHVTTDESLLSNVNRPGKLYSLFHINHLLDLRADGQSLFIIPNIIIHMHLGNLRHYGH